MGDLDRLPPLHEPSWYADYDAIERAPLSTRRVYAGEGAMDPAQVMVSVQARPLSHAVRVIFYVLGVVEVLLGVRVAFSLLGASPSALCTDLVYVFTWPLVLPYMGVFPSPAENGHMLDAAAALAMIGYALIAWGASSYVHLRHTARQKAVQNTGRNGAGGT
jgi:hypothetical protein